MSKKLNHKQSKIQLPKAGEKHPVVGVVTSRKGKADYPFPRGRESLIYREMIEAAYKKAMLLYYFYPDQVNWKARTIKGHVYRNGRWISQIFPFPDIVYNRIVYRKVEGDSQVKKVLDRFRKMENLLFFNTRFLDKWEVYQALMSSEKTSCFSPASKILNNESLHEFCAKYDLLFIKPRNSNTGKGIVKLEKLSHQGWRCCFTKGKELLCSDYAAIKEVNQGLKAIIKTGNDFIIQQGIPLSRYNKRIFDIRGLVQKDGSGDWTFTGAGVRMAAPGRFLTHIPNGGKAASYDDILEKVFTKSSVKKSCLDEQVNEICSTVPGVLEEYSGLCLAVLSIDIGLDEEGRMWVIEVNSKPAGFDEKAIRMRHLDYLTDYFLYLLVR